MKVVNSEKWVARTLIPNLPPYHAEKHHEVVQNYSTTSNLPSICNPWWGE
jgi:hypothetical protein